MALIKTLNAGKMDRISLHDGIEATYFTHEFDGRKLLQINTSGRSSREMPDKVSQSIQFDEESGRQLFDLLKGHFGFR